MDTVAATVTRHHEAKPEELSAFHTVHNIGLWQGYVAFEECSCGVADVLAKCVLVRPFICFGTFGTFGKKYQKYRSRAVLLVVLALGVAI